VTLINRETIWITSDEILNFPPSQTEFTSKRPIEFVVKEKPSQVVVSIEKFQTRVINLNVHDEKEIIIIREIVANGLTFEFVKEKGKA